jgi:hypothetical protein
MQQVGDYQKIFGDASASAAKFTLSGDLANTLGLKL